VRELETLLWQAMTRSRGDVLEFDASDDDEQPEQPDTLEPNDALGTSTAGSGIDPLSIPPEQIQACLDANDGRQEPTWRALGLTSRYVLTRLVKRHNLRVRGRS
jgi:transcriptional regulator with GAF, ATPase, and Fis domain